MKAIQELFKKNSFACLGLIVFTLCMALVFSEAFPKFVALVSPDSGPFFSFAPRTAAFESLLTGATFTPQKLYWLLLNPLYAHDLTYILDTFFLTLAGVYYLMGRRVHPLAAWTGGLALGLCGYTFTLFCAGHRGYFHMFSCAMWAFGLLSRCFETRKLFYFAMLGLVLAWAVPYQPDVMLFVGAVAAAYALWLTGCAKPETGSWRREVGRRIVSVWPKFGVSLLVIGLAGFDGVRSAVTTQVSNREAQISGAKEQTAQTGMKPAKRSAKEEHDRWIFATNWSLPPEDMLEFVVPGVFGNDSMQMPNPYWGRLGRPADEVFQKGRMMPNYRQHTVYLGVISVLLAFLGVMAYFGRRKTKRVSSLQPTSDLRPPTSDYSDIPFWCGVWVVCLVLAMGRYTPFYRLFYSIPYMGYIRDPVKFHHLVEVATAFLAGFGMDAFLRSGAGALRRKLAWLSACLAGSLLVGALVFWVAQPLIQRHISELGLGQVAAVLGGYSVQNLVRSACLAVLVSGVAWAASRWGGRSAVGLGCGLMIVLAAEQSCVALRYVRVINVEPFYYENAVVKAIHKASGGQMVNAINYVTPNAWPQDWFSTALSMNGIRNLMPGSDEKETLRGKLFAALQGDPGRLWRLCHVRYVIIPRKGGQPLLRAGVLAPVLDFELGAGVVRPVQPSDTSFLLARVCDVSPTPRFVAGWQGGVPVDKQIDVLGSGSLDVSDAPMAPVQGRSFGEAGTVRVIASHGSSGVLATRVEVTAKVPGLFIFDERKTGSEEVLVDGRPATLYVANAVWPAVLVPEGEHEVVLRNKRNFTLFLLSGLMSVGLLVWWIGGVASRRAVAAGKSV